MINKNLMLVAMLSMGTALTTLGKVKPTLASLTPPTTYDYSYTWNAAASEQYLNANGVDSIPLYTRTADGAYYNYTSTFNVIDGLSVTQTFNRSNTTWQASGIFYKPDENRIGADNTVGSASKLRFTFTNITNRDFRLYFDNSSTGAFSSAWIVDLTMEGFQIANDVYTTTSFLNSYLITSHTTISLNNRSITSQSYFDAWYLKDLGISDAYQAGYDANRGGILTDYLGTDAQQIGWVLLGIAAILFVFKGGK
jgi:hypothetical protein